MHKLAFVFSLALVAFVTPATAQQQDSQLSRLRQALEAITRDTNTPTITVTPAQPHGILNEEGTASGGSGTSSDAHTGTPSVWTNPDVVTLCNRSPGQTVNPAILSTWRQVFDAIDAIPSRRMKESSMRTAAESIALARSGAWMEVQVRATMLREDIYVAGGIQWNPIYAEAIQCLAGIRSAAITAMTGTGPTN